PYTTMLRQMGIWFTAKRRCMFSAKFIFPPKNCLQSCHGRVRFGNASGTRSVHLRSVGACQMRLNNIKGSFSLGAISEMDHHDAAANAENDFPFFAKESANTGIAGN
ncbi:hypothetical protein, partial [Sutterella wadsworthensis]|uniref:hypothetical protein n=1 Tax=Sutterella wadsworthensis TaxID=40545 RepID=UPI003AAE5E43